jgi:FtsH-binding integral membrane protein
MSTVSPYRDSELRFSEPSIGKFAGKVYSWMAIMLGVTAATSFFAIHAGINQWLEHNSGVFGLLLILELALVMLFSGFRKHFSFTKGVSLLGAYTVLNGLTLSAVLNHYKVSTLGVAFLSSAGLFGMANQFPNLARLLPTNP